MTKYIETYQQRQTRLTNFKHHAPIPDQMIRLLLIRDEANRLAYALNITCPPSRELSLAMTKLEECVSWASVSIVRNEHIDAAHTDAADPKTNNSGA